MPRRHFYPYLLLLLLSTGCAARGSGPEQKSRDTYANPLDVLIADPFIFREGNTYYLYGTASDDGLQVWTSADMVDWRLRGYAWKRTKDTWSHTYFWAPELFKHHDKYYLHYTAVGPERKRRIVLAEGDSPLGPFTEKMAPWWDPHNSVIDSHVFKDDDGKMYLYAVYTPDDLKGTFQIRVHTLDDQLRPSKESTLCIVPEKPWEGGMVNEGPFIVKHDGYYLLTYSFNGFQDPNYSVGIAWSKSPTGPWNKTADGPILKRIEGVSGPGHHCFIDSPDHKEWFIAYHTHQFLNAPGGPRQLAIDRAKSWTVSLRRSRSLDRPSPRSRCLQDPRRSSVGRAMSSTGVSLTASAGPSSAKIPATGGSRTACSRSAPKTATSSKIAATCRTSFCNTRLKEISRSPAA